MFANVRNDMTIAREEIFGPVLCDPAVRHRGGRDPHRQRHGRTASPATSRRAIAQRALRVASRLRAGNVHLNGAGPDFTAPFGGYKQSGNGREWGEFGFEEFLEVKAVMGSES